MSDPFQPVQQPAAAEPATPTAAQPAAELREYPFTFHGNGAEFFRIWIVNVALTVITLGFYLPWARVRTRKYFYGNTLLNDRTFDYLAKPTALLKGYLIVVSAIIVFQVASAMQLWWLILILLPTYFGVYPWLIFKSLRFKCHNSAYSNVRLRFTGRCSQAYVVYMLLGIATAFFGIFILPLQMYMIKQYIFGNLAVGESESESRLDAGKFYLYYLIYLIPAALMIVLFFCFFFYIMVSASKMSDFESLDDIKVPLEEVEAAPAEESPDGQAEATEEAGAENEEVSIGEEFPEFEEFEKMMPSLITFGIIFVLLYLFTAVVAGQFVFVKTTNHTLANTTLGSCRLHSDMRVRDMIWIMISNFFLCIITLGIYFPWAMVRVRKYRIEHMKLFTYGELQEFIATKESEQDALGDAAGDYLDFEIGF